MLSKLLVAVATAMLAVSALAVDSSQVQKAVPLKDGSTVYLLKNGKMAMEDKYGRAVRMEPGVVMETKDGQRIAMIGDEVAYLSSLLSNDNRK
jgi:hypothetical protein